QGFRRAARESDLSLQRLHLAAHRSRLRSQVSRRSDYSLPYRLKLKTAVWNAHHRLNENPFKRVIGVLNALQQQLGGPNTHLITALVKPGERRIQDVEPFRIVRSHDFHLRRKAGVAFLQSS